MLEHYYVKPSTIDRIRNSRLGSPLYRPQNDERHKSRRAKASTRYFDEGGVFASLSA
jgi:hypothetical protein